MKNCLICGVSYKPNGTNQKLCGSHECHLARRRITEDRVIKERECRHCGDNFLPVHGQYHYCTNKCFAENRRIRKHVTPQEKECVVCGSSFTHGRKDKKICSIECKKAHTKKYKKKFNKNAITNCVICGVEFPKLRAQMTCSKECREIQRTQYRDNWVKETGYYTNPTVKLSSRMSSRLRATLKHKNISKNNRTFAILGYSKGELKERFETLFAEGMSWDNMSEWHIDHIRPVSSFNFTTTDCEDFKKCWALDNLQPLWAIDNLRKSNKWDGEAEA